MSIYLLELTILTILLKSESGPNTFQKIIFEDKK